MNNNARNITKEGLNDCRETICKIFLKSKKNLPDLKYTEN